MSFKDTFTRLCSERGESPSTVCMRLGYSNAVYSQWTDDTIPRNSTLSKIADYFGVSTDYLLGKEDNQSSHSLLRPNTICITGKDGTYISKKLTDEQIAMLKTMIDSLPDAKDF